MTESRQPLPPWNAPAAEGPVHATIAVPGSKSITNRALLLAAMADGPSTITGWLRARDSELMIHGLTRMGLADVTRDVRGRLRVEPQSRHDVVADVDCGLAGTVMRFLPPATARVDGKVRFDGDPRARQRPMGPLLDALRTLGFAVTEGADRLPFTIAGTGWVRGGPVRLDASGSSQFVSGLLLSGARFEHGVEVVHDGPPIPSMPHLQMTMQMLAEHGVRADADVEDPRRARWGVLPGVIRARDRDVEPDLSNALPFLAAAMATGGEVTVTGWPEHTTQPGGRLPDLLGRMGGRSRLTRDGLTIVGPDRLQGLEADLHDEGELTPVLAALCALAGTPSRLTGIAHLRGHETDRLAALARELTQMGARVDELPDGLAITPGRLRPTVFGAYDDHRMATAGAVLGLVVPGTRVDDIETTAKTLPGFADRWEAMVRGDRADA